mmetsp:Transcript_5431/g.9149  ORF Transcript_5431/g.9149 Transcript_5431/m.9149 type:complete len:461 (+) Transcript_5431:541-1923(+)
MITVLGLFTGIYADSLGRLGPAIHIWSSIDPHLILLLFLPALIFESAFNSDWHIFKVEFAQVIIMAGPMLIGATYLSAGMMYYILGYNGDAFPWEAALLFGSIISATDPVAVVCLLKELGASKRLATMIEGESLLNDGTAMVVFLVLQEIVEGNSPTAMDIVIKFVRLSFGGPLLGILVGVIVSAILKRIHNNFVLEVNTTIFASYLLFFVAESTSVHVSGILAIVALGLYMTNTGKTRISAESEHSVHHVWGYIGFVAETVIFILTGVIMGERAVGETQIGFNDYMKLIGTYLMLHVIRFIMIFIFWPLLSKMGYGMSFNQVILCSYAGLRGAVGMSLALIVAASDKIPRYIQDVVLLHVAGVALLTLLINATTTGMLVRYLGLSRQSDIKKSILMGLTFQLEKNVDKNIEVLKTKRHFNHIIWDNLKEQMKLNELKEKLKQYKNLQLEGEEVPDDVYA